MKAPTEENTPVEPHAALHGSLVGPWRVLELRGSGTFGLVFRAVLDAEPSTVGAVKVAREPADPRFEREAELLARCRSPHLPRLLDKGLWRSPQGLAYPYLVMSWIQGVPLYEWAKVRGLSNAQAVRALAHVARALAEVHVRGALHRDVKGDNVLVDGDGFAVLVDAGVAWTPCGPPITEPGHLPPGTLQYRSPEAHAFRGRGEKRYTATTADDLYALGVMAYRLCTGTYPGTGTFGGHARALVRPSELATVCPELERLILRWLSPEPEARGTSEGAARCLEELLKSGGAHLAGPVKRTMVEETRRSSRRALKPSPSSLAWAGGSALGVLAAITLMVGFEWLGSSERYRHSLGEAERGEEAPVAELADAGVAEVALAAVHREPVAHLGVAGVGKAMPKEPFPGQRKPPCAPPEEVAIQGGCWVGPIGKLKPPCGAKSYDYQDGCYIPSFNAPREPTSSGRSER